MAEQYEGIRFNPEREVVEGFDNTQWQHDLKDLLVLLDRSFPHTRPSVVNRQTGEVGENKRFVPRPDEVFFQQGFDESFYNAFTQDQAENLEARRNLYDRLNAFIVVFYPFTYIAATDGLVPIYRSETLSEDEGRICMMHVEPTKVNSYHDGDGSDPTSHERVKRYLQVLLPDFSSPENFFPCALEFGKKWVDENGIVQRQQKKIHFPQSLPGGKVAPDMLHHLQSYDFRALREVLADLHQFSVEQTDAIQERWGAIQSQAIVMQAHDKQDPKYRLPGVIVGSMRS